MRRALRAGRQRRIQRARAVLRVEALEERWVPSVDPGTQALQQIDHFVVIYQENWSFDALYGNFPGANGLQNAAAAGTIPQVDVNGNPLIYTPSPLNNGVIDPNFPSVMIGGKSYLAFPAIDADTGLPDPNAGQPVPIGPYDIAKYIQPNQKTGDIVHKFYHEQLQIDTGNPAIQSSSGSMDKFVAVSDNPGLVMSHFDASNLPEGLLAQQYTMDDNFFHAAYGGSFLNHQFLVAAAAPEWNQAIPNANFVSHPAVNTAFPDGGMNKAGHDSNLTGNDLLAADGNHFVVNTTFSANLVPSFSTPGASTLLNSINDSNPNDPNRPYEQNIGDLLSQADVNWKWYSGGWDAAVNLQKAYASGDPAQIAAAKAPFNDPTNPLNLFQWHHQPFAYFDNYSPLSAGGQAHLQDETNFFNDLANGDLPSVSFIKPLGPDNEHPGYAALLQGQQHVADIVHAVQNSPDWAHTAIIITYDENGGRWDHVTPPNNNGPWGDGTRVPTIVISPYAKQGYVDHTEHDTLSILSTIEQRYGLQPLTQYDANASTLASDFQLKPHVSIGSAYVQPDANNPGKFTLVVQGTEGNDHILITQVPTGIRVQIETDADDHKGDAGHKKGDYDFDQTFTQPISRLEVYGQGGNDDIKVDPAVTVPAFLFGGAGNDEIHAGGGASVLVGGDGNNELFGGSGPNILIGGTGHDILRAGSAGDILIAGTTKFDANISALKALEAEWTRTDISYTQKVADLTGGSTTPGKNGTYFLNADTVEHGKSSELIGGSGMDLFYAELGRRHKDDVDRLMAGEVVIDI
jgi:phospholipase C